ncbi:Protein kinase domain [Macleaya cordata]|uniref:mitogen-activated protein kinase kinase kinase n=1 Tax=Macleaya cordata TaxID=56857 RepID=A0A200PXX5_MACCD|nr:Protein kinase domain [Macleaya cordata]
MDHHHQKQKKPKPKLDRRNAIKYTDHYDLDPTTSSSSSLPEEDQSSSSSSLRTRSLDILPSYSDRTSFRIGGIDGEIDRICLTLGLSGPEDFAISTAAWEARKTKSSSELLPRPRIYQLDSIPDDAAAAAADKLEEKEVVDDGEFETRFEARVRFGDGLVRENCSPSTIVTSGSSSGGGIKGIRPPVLAPPPSISLPVLDNSGSTWDLVRAFAPEDLNDNCKSNSRVSCSRVKIPESSSDEEEEEEVEEEDEEEEVGGAIVVERDEVLDGERLGETAVLSDSCSFTTSNDEDSSSTTTENMFIISPNGRFKRNIKSWTKGKFLGSGSYGTVYEGFSDDGFFFAVKEVSLLDQGSQGRQSIYQLEQEIALLSQFEHENIVQYLGTDKAEGKLFIFLDLVTKGSLAQLYENYDLRDSQVSAYTRQILHGLCYLHDRDVIHRDIKCANILVDANGSVKLADFGLAKTTKLNDVKSSKGTAFWMAPEVVNRKTIGYGLPADIWSLGCTVLEMLTHQLPYYPLEWMQAIFRIGRGEPPPVPNNLSIDARDFILQCLQVKPEDRPTAAKLLDHPFVKRPLPASSGSESPFHNSWR